MVVGLENSNKNGHMLNFETSGSNIFTQSGYVKTADVLRDTVTTNDDLIQTNNLTKAS